MTDNSVLLKQIFRNPVMASYDASCKRLLSNKTILAWIIKSCIKEYEACEIEYIAKHCLEENSMVGQAAVHPDEVFCGEQIRGSAQQDTSAQEGTITYDIKVCAWLPGTEEGKERGRLFLDIEALRLLEVLLSPYMRAGEKIKILKDEFSIVMERKFEEEVREMCDLSIGVAEWGMEQGIKEGICTAIKNLMSTTNWSAEQAMEALKIPEKEREAYAEQLREQTV